MIAFQKAAAGPVTAAMSLSLEAKKPRPLYQKDGAYASVLPPIVHSQLTLPASSSTERHTGSNTLAL